MKKLIVILMLLATGCSTYSNYGRYGAQKIDMESKELTLGAGHYNDMRDLLDSNVLLKNYGCTPVDVRQEPPGFNQFHQFFIKCR